MITSSVNSRIATHWIRTLQITKKLLDSGLNRERALKKLKLKDVPLTGEENYKYLQSVWTNKAMKTFRDFLCWYNNKDVVPTLEAMQKMMEFYHNKGIDMLKLGCTLPNLANICLHNSTNHIFYPFCGTDKDLLEKIREDMTGGPSIVFTRKAVVNETFIRKSKNVCKAIVGIRCQSIVSLFNVSTNANRTLHSLGVQY